MYSLKLSKNLKNFIPRSRENLVVFFFLSVKEKKRKKNSLTQNCEDPY